jgi:hypothetical protein
MNQRTAERFAEDHAISIWYLLPQKVRHALSLSRRQAYRLHSERYKDLGSFASAGSSVYAQRKSPSDSVLKV